MASSVHKVVEFHGFLEHSSADKHIVSPASFVVDELTIGTQHYYY